MIVDNLISKNDIKVKGEIIADVSTADRAIYDTKGRDLSDLFINKENVSGSIEFATSILPANVSWQSVCYGNGKFVAVAGNSGKIAAYSTDGINWTQTTLPNSANWYSVCYGNGKFVAVCGSNIAAYSTDGINWTQTTLPTTDWYSVCYGNGKFVAVSYNSSKIAAYSTDGINWTKTTLPADTDWYSVCYGNGKFVAVSYGNNIAAYSTYGINWTQTKLPTSGAWISVCYGNGKFVAVMFNSGIAAYSTDGINWTQTKLPADIRWNSVCYGNGKFVAVCGSNIAAYSISKTISEDISYLEDNAKNLLKPINKGKSSIVSSQWNSGSNPPTSNQGWQSICYGNNVFVAVAYSGNSNSNKIMYSPDGIDWKLSTVPVSEAMVAVCYGTGYFIAICYNSKTTLYSTDGINWTKGGDLTTAYFLMSVGYCNGYFYIVGCNASSTSALSSYYYSSDNGKTWTSTGINSNSQYAKYIFSDNKNNLIVVNGGSNSVSGILYKDVSSTHNGVFNNASLPSSARWYAGAYGNGTYVVIARASNKAAYTTTANGDSGWTASTLPFTGEWDGITFGNGYFVAVAANTDKAAISKDGKTWSTIILPRSANWSGIAYANGRFVVIDYDNGKVAYLTTHIK